MNEVIFIVEENEEGGYRAKGLGVSIFTEADNMPELKEAIKDAVRCHFDEDDKSRPQIIRLHLIKEELIAA